MSEAAWLRPQNVRGCLAPSQTETPYSHGSIRVPSLLPPELVKIPQAATGQVSMLRYIDMVKPIKGIQMGIWISQTKPDPYGPNGSIRQT